MRDTLFYVTASKAFKEEGMQWYPWKALSSTKEYLDKEYLGSNSSTLACNKESDLYLEAVLLEDCSTAEEARTKYPEYFI